MKTSSQIRQAYLDFFIARGHTLKPSAPLIPQGDPTLMFNSAGMVPFKPYFLGLKKDLIRACSAQKCFRTTDIDRVGTTLRHLTFFEMLGNFSFGDYFKKDAVAWAWEFLVKEIGLEPKRLHPTVFKDDAEAAGFWESVGIKNPVVRLGEETNFWAVGPTGPCGPCSEIYYDLGPEFETPGGDNTVGGDGDRYLEIWNLVFMQFDRQANGELKPLPRQNIDTGMGLERLVLAVQGRPTPFHTDLFTPIVDEFQKIVGKPRDTRTELAYRVIGDHTRAATMLMAEGVIPSNVDRGYVLRRLIRRALRYGQLHGVQEPFLHKLVFAAASIFEKGYPELKTAAPQVAATLRIEEEKFLETLAAGEVELNKMLTHGGNLQGEKAFRLYETFGFPLELTKEVCAQKGVIVDEDGFHKAKEKAAEVARASWKGSGAKAFHEMGLKLQPTQFTGYTQLETLTVVTDVQRDILVLEKTPFYAEGGGQVGDCGWILSADGKSILAEVVDTQKQGKTYLHILRNAHPSLSPLAKVLARVDKDRRARIKPHHTGTHLMNEALKRVLGPGVRQAGSYVGPDKLRFDFTFGRALTPEEIATIEKIVNDEIAAAHPVIPRELHVSKVAELGATTLLGEDYGENPRFLLIGPKGWDAPKDRFSLELCGGTHCDNTAEILSFKIVKEASVSAGVRRIEALCGRALEEWLAQKEAQKKKSLELLEAREKTILSEIAALGGKAKPCAQRGEAALKDHLKILESTLGALKAQKLAAQAEAGRRVIETKGVKLCAQRLDGADPKSLRGLTDKMKAEFKDPALLFLAAEAGGKLSFVMAATTPTIDAGKIAKAFAASHGGSAGGRPDFAQGGIPSCDWDALVKDLVQAL